MIHCKSNNKTCALAEVPSHLQRKSQSILEIHKNLVFADTTVATISGKIYGESIYSDKKFQQEDTLPFANISLTNVETQEIVGTTTNSDGVYSFSIPAATYQLKISFIGYNIVLIENLQLGTGEIFKLSAQLGLGIEKEYFTILNHRDTKELVRKPD